MTTTIPGSTEVAHPQHRHPHTQHHVVGSGLSFAGILHSEWIKLRSVRSTLWCYVAIVVLTVGLGMLLAVALPAPTTTPSTNAQQSTWLTVTTLGVNFAQLIIAVLGALVITGEYGTGMIRSTFVAVPTRLPALAAKVLVFGVTTFVVSLAALVATALATAPLLPAQGVHPDLGDTSIWIALVGGAGYLTLIGCLALAIGTILRSTAGSIAASLGLVLVVPIILRVVANLTQAQWAANINVFLPSNAGGRLFAYPAATSSVLSPPAGTPNATSLSTIVLEPWQALLVLAGWFVVALVVGAILLKRRDA
ncbi:MAG: ABC transporter permease [Actinomycetota bacterium]|nr:ABC transporter permease [Actinomycetota bacterium]